MTITKIKINKVSGEKGLIGFAQIVLDDCLFLGGIGIFSRLNEPQKIRLVFPTKKRNGVDIRMFCPLTESLYRQLEKEIQNKIGLI